MSTLIEIEQAASRLTAEERQQLISSLTRGLCTEGYLPPPREFSVEEMNRWVEEDEADFKRFKEMA